MSKLWCSRARYGQGMKEPETSSIVFPGSDGCVTGSSKRIGTISGVFISFRMSLLGHGFQIDPWAQV